MIKLEAGRLYRLRNGEIHQADPNRNMAGIYLSFILGKRYYSPDGWHENPDYTVIAEVPEAEWRHIRRLESQLEAGRAGLGRLQAELKAFETQDYDDPVIGRLKAILNREGWL